MRAITATPDHAFMAYSHLMSKRDVRPYLLIFFFSPMWKCNDKGDFEVGKLLVGGCKGFGDSSMLPRVVFSSQ